MAWNEPGGNSKDPWSGKGGDQGPPDLDEVVKKMQEKLGGLFGGKGGGDRGGPDDHVPGPGSAGFKGIGALVMVGLVLFLAFKSFYTVEPAERGVILRFGEYKNITQPGPHFLIPVVDEVIKVNVDQISSFRHNATMLTRDENIVDIELTVQSKIQDAADYLFQDQSPEKTIRDATETAVRETIGKSDLDFILTEGRSSIADTIKQGIQELLVEYRTGLEVTSVNMQPAKPPEQVKSSFDDAIKAREDKEKLENQAEAYANEVVPKARGAAARRVEDAKAYKEKVIAEAEGEASRFLAVLGEYEKAPEVTRQRLYLDTVEEVMGNSRKVLLDAEGGNSLMYLPLDKLIQSSTEVPSSRAQTLQEQSEKRAESSGRDVQRGRRTR
ncbi:FtsH protease activity modulator HflK [Solemya velesiana gill symbiont]|uniref:Protein HflK n=1 Tax=Solemya velesiana gill symbiont TaxID=1918948 RepID=A0A1T2KS95_9GAMM|nr:FtsH protease activity modulator HflK [Solemya velesiana gill symbiont]OOZ35738.1 HflK protein [Solemya velesiana gill symbiont]